MKKIMMLGGNYFQMTATKKARELGHYVISVDYLPDNPAHKYAHEYYNVSTTDKEAVLKLAKKLKIDGIISYASDVSAPTAAYVAENLGLPTNPYNSVCILTNKNKMREFMAENGFNVPKGSLAESYEQSIKIFEKLNKPVMVKPIDSSGSKGVHKINTIDELENAYKDAKYYSRLGVVIVEEFIEKIGYQIDADGFLVNGKFAYFGVMDQHNDFKCNPHVPIGLSGPSILSKEYIQKAKIEIQRLMSLLNMKAGALNMEYIFDKNGELYIIEIGPRNGGNLIPDTIEYASGIDLPKFSIQAALGLDCSELKDVPFNISASSYIIHSSKSGIFKRLEISNEVKKDIQSLEIFVNIGDKVNKFDNAGHAIGAAIVKFDNINQMLERIDNMERYIKVIVE